MSEARNKNNRIVDWVEVTEQLATVIPQVCAFWDSRDDFSELRLKARDDGTILAILKGYGSSGDPIVAFGVGLSVTAALIGLEGSVAANHWKADKPWDASKG